MTPSLANGQDKRPFEGAACYAGSGMTVTDLSGSLPRAVAWLLIVGAAVFWVGAGTPPYKQWMGPPIEEYLTIIGTHPRNWTFINGSFAVACVLTVPALAGLTA